jgi:GNAT superfamily N-acetyltransferase
VTITVRAHRNSELDLLARMNKALIDDEGSRNPMDLAALRRRIVDFLADRWSADLFEQAGGAVGYALHRYEADPNAPDRPVVHLRQFFIVREHRRAGIGRAAFTALAASRWRRRDRIVLDVLATNPAGRSFWDALGFAPYSAKLEMRA